MGDLTSVLSVLSVLACWSSDADPHLSTLTLDSSVLSLSLLVGLRLPLARVASLYGLCRRELLFEPLTWQICLGEVDVMVCKASRSRLDSLQLRIEMGKSLADKLLRKLASELTLHPNGASSVIYSYCVMK